MDEPAAAAPGRTLKLSGIHASGVPDMDSTTPGKAQHADPYVVFQVVVGGQVFSSARTKHMLNAANPVWDDRLELPLPEPSDAGQLQPLVLRVRLMDKDFSTADDPIAHAEAELRGVRGPMDIMAQPRPGQGPAVAIPIGLSYAIERDGVPEEEQAEEQPAPPRAAFPPPVATAAEAEAADSQNWYVEHRQKDVPRRKSLVQFAAPEDNGGSVLAQKLEAPSSDVLVHPMARVPDEAHTVDVAHSPEAVFRPQLPPAGTDSLPAATDLSSRSSPLSSRPNLAAEDSPRPLLLDAPPTRPLKPIVPASLLRLVPDAGTQLKSQPSWKRVGASARPRGSRRADVPIEAVGARRGSPSSRRRGYSGGDGATLDSPSSSRRRSSCASVASAATAASRLSGSPRRRRRKEDEKLVLKESDNAVLDMLPSFAGFLCGARVGTPGMRPPEAVVQHLLRKTGEGLSSASRALEQVVDDASAAATLLVDDIGLRAQEHARRGAGDPSTVLRQEPVTAFVRFRSAPDGGSRVRHTATDVEIAPEHAGMAPIRFVLDGVLDANCDQEAAYARVGAEAIEELLRGQSRSLIACGAAGAGKTYSLFGSPELLANPSSDAWKGWGLLPRTGHHLFARANAVGGLEALCGPGGSVKCSFLEIFDERVNDLLGKGRNLRVRESAAHGVYVPEAVHRLIEWEEDVMRALVLGLQNRTLALPYASNGAAPALGFSHTIFTLTISMRTSEGEVKESRLQLIDLGSPETLRPGVSAGHKPSTPAQRSLAALSSCITAQADGSGQGVPYRDSKLTWLLRDALGGNNVPAGNARLSILAACELRQEALPATMATLRFAQRCRHARMWVAAAIDPRHPVTGLLPLPFQRGGAQVAAPPVAHLSTDVSPPVRMTASQTLSLQRGPASESDSEDGLEGMPSVAAAGRRLNFSDAGGSAARFADAQADATHAQAPAMDPRATGGGMESAEGWGQLVEAHEHMLQLETKLELARSTSVDAMRANSPGLVAFA